MRARVVLASLGFAAVLFGVTAKTAFGQISGCVDSPEDPTVVMAALGVTAAAVRFGWFRIRNRRR